MGAPLVYPNVADEGNERRAVALYGSMKVLLVEKRAFCPTIVFSYDKIVRNFPSSINLGQSITFH
jgi:hypothetical protein